MTYRPDIDGLRALAVLPVILFHADITAFSGGFVGVGIFFVISGYLITRLLVQEFATGTFSLSHFYAHRARRIMPALLIMVVVTLTTSFFYYYLLNSTKPGVPQRNFPISSLIICFGIQKTIIGNRTHWRSSHCFILGRWLSKNSFMLSFPYCWDYGSGAGKAPVQTRGYASG